MNTEFILGRPVNRVSMHQHEEFLLTEAVLEHPERTLAEIVDNVYCMPKQDVSMLWQVFFYYLKRNHFSRYRVCQIFLRPLRCHVIQINKMEQNVYFFVS